MASRPTRYQYSFQNTKLDAGGVVLAGTVTISNGVKTVTNVTANGLPTTSFDPADFLTPEDVFAVVADVESQGAELAHVTYDQQWGFPAAVVIIRSIGIRMTDYRVFGFVDLSVAGGREWISGWPSCLHSDVRRPADPTSRPGFLTSRGRSVRM